MCQVNKLENFTHVSRLSLCKKLHNADTFRGVTNAHMPKTKRVSGERCDQDIKNQRGTYAALDLDNGWDLWFEEVIAVVPVTERVRAVTERLRTISPKRGTVGEL